MRFIKPCLLGLVSLLCLSCSLKQQHVLFEQRNTPRATAAGQEAENYKYHIRPYDQLQIRNLYSTRFLTPDAPATPGTTPSSAVVTPEVFQVEEDGRVTLPGLGHIPIAGLTRMEATGKIEKMYKDSLLSNNAIIEVKILNLKVTLWGEVKAQGVIPLVKEHTSLIDVIGQAGGLTAAADEKQVKIIRGKDLQEIYVDLGDKRSINDPLLIMQPDDVITIGQNKRAVRDDKIQNFSTLVQPSLLIFNTALIIYTLFKK